MLNLWNISLYTLHAIIGWIIISFRVVTVIKPSKFASFRFIHQSVYLINVIDLGKQIFTFPLFFYNFSQILYAYLVCNVTFDDHNHYQIYYTLKFYGKRRKKRFSSLHIFEMVESISKSVEEQEQDEIRFSYIGQINSGYGKDNSWLLTNVSHSI